MLESMVPEIAYKCDICGELFNSPEDVRHHNQKAHAESMANRGSESSIIGTGTPSEDREIERAMSNRVV